MLTSVIDFLLWIRSLLENAILNPATLPWLTLAAPLAAAEDALARLDERLRTSPIGEGWRARTHFSDACASLWLDGELAHLADLVLHDARMDVRAPTHELTRAHTVLRTRRRVAEAAPDWALSSAGLALLCRQELDAAQPDGEGRALGTAPDNGSPDNPEADWLTDPADDSWAAQLAAIDAVVARSTRLLTGEASARRERAPLVYDSDWDERARLTAWHRSLHETRALPPTLAAALALTTWETQAPLQHRTWLGRLLAAALLRDRGKTEVHLLPLNCGLRAIPRERRRSADSATRLVATLEAITAAALGGLAEHDRWLNARRQLERKLAGRRATSRLPALVDLIMTRPLVTAGMIAQALAITPRAAQDLVATLGLREMTGRDRYRAWGIV